ncbi:Acg family FMN-binding oxidoreductase [Embleya sp. NPDC050493]|uniref:Acg family FMN-binding oxidoreductase n=1 Tax=Embleya sp. NPDC050493 TaxID=3363989 RepID=UPI0037A9EC12
MTNASLNPADLRYLAAAGGAAPSLHNSQPWSFRPTSDGRGIAVYADTTRAVPLTDPDGRALYISVGAAVFNLRVAAAQLGRDPLVTLLPHGPDPAPAAVLDLSRRAHTHDADLYPAIALRRSSRLPFANRDVPERIVGELMAAADAEDVVLAVLEEADARRVLNLTAEAERRTAADLARQAETREWLRPEEPATDGIPYQALGPQDHDARVPVRGFTGHPPTPPTPTQRFEALPQVATLTTRFDRPEDWLRAGQAMERVWLTATLHGLRMSVLHQAVEWPDTRASLRDPHTGPGYVQMVLRMGYGPPGAATPRRAVEETLQPTETGGDTPAADGSGARTDAPVVSGPR